MTICVIEEAEDFSVNRVMYTLHREQFVKTTVKRAWDFIKNPANLNHITPADLDFRIISDFPDEMHDGLIIEYNIRIPFIGCKKWLTEIKHIKKPYSFVDDQRIGPYKLWYHYHELQEVDGGVKFIDKVYYEVPFWIIGKIAHSLFIRKLLARIFDYRKNKFMEILESEDQILHEK